MKDLKLEPPNFPQPSARQRQRQHLITNLALNVTQRDREMFKQGYVPISWFLANLTYNEATAVAEIIRSLDSAQMRDMVKPKGWI